MKMLDVCSVIFQEDMLVAALFDGREGQEAIAIVKPVIRGDIAVLEISDPDGLERYKWLEKFGLMTEEQLNELYKTVQAEDEQRLIYDELKMKFDAPRVRMIEKKEKAIVQKEKELTKKEANLKSWQEKLNAKE